MKIGFSYINEDMKLHNLILLWMKLFILNNILHISQNINWFVDLIFWTVRDFYLIIFKYNSVWTHILQSFLLNVYYISNKENYSKSESVKLSLIESVTKIVFTVNSVNCHWNNQ